MQNSAENYKQFLFIKKQKIKGFKFVTFKEKKCAKSFLQVLNRIWHHREHWKIRIHSHTETSFTYNNLFRLFAMTQANSHKTSLISVIPGGGDQQPHPDWDGHNKHQQFIMRLHSKFPSLDRIKTSFSLLNDTNWGREPKQVMKTHARKQHLK